MSWGRPIRKLHRWASVAFTLAVAVNMIALSQEGAPVWIGFLALAPLAILQVTGLYLLVQPWLRGGTAPTQDTGAG